MRFSQRSGIGAEPAPRGEAASRRTGPARSAADSTPHATLTSAPPPERGSRTVQVQHSAKKVEAASNSTAATGNRPSSSHAVEEPLLALPHKNRSPATPNSTRTPTRLARLAPGSDNAWEAAVV